MFTLYPADQFLRVWSHFAAPFFFCATLPSFYFLINLASLASIVLPEHLSYYGNAVTNLCYNSLNPESILKQYQKEIWEASLLHVRLYSQDISVRT